MASGISRPKQGDPVVVMKFGGTSVATETGRSAIAARVTEALGEGKAPVVVVSAMGRRGDPYATDTLLGLVAELPGNARDRDLLASVGEVISAVVVAHELRASGIEARAFTGAEAGISTDGVFEGASINEIHPWPLTNALADGIVPVVCGFQGIDDDGCVTTLGRGGSDTTACALGVALGAEAVEIYTDVDGVMSTDPRRCENAAVLEVVSAEELSQMARHGSRVVHTPAAELALSSGLALRVRNTYSDHPGTAVADIASYRPAGVATAVTQSGEVVRLRVSLPADEGTPAHMRAQTEVYRAMADAGISLDMFTPMGPSLVFTIDSSALPRAREILAGLGMAHDSQDGLAKVTLVGAGMHGVPGVMARVAECLDECGVEVFQVADSHTTISVLVAASKSDQACAALHSGFGLGAGECALDG